MNWKQVLTDPSAKAYYTSSSTGLDTNTGLDPSVPLKTIAAALRKLRAGLSGDRILLKTGDTFVEPFIDWRTVGSNNPEAPAGIFAYGNSAAGRPIVKATKNNHAHVLFNSCKNLMFSGYDVIADRDPTDTHVPCGFEVGQYFENLTFEDLHIIGFGNNLSIINNSGTPSKNVQVRGCVIQDAWGGSEYSGQGIYTENLDGLLVEDCYLWNNGYVPQPSVYRHGMYLSQHGTTNAKIRRCFVGRSGSFGVQLRGSGDVQDCFFYDNGCAASIGGEYGSITGSVVWGSHDPIQQVMSGGFSLNAKSSVCYDNVLYDPAGSQYKGQYPGAGIALDSRDWTPAGIRSAMIFNNVICGWPGDALQIIAPWQIVTMDNNYIDQLNQRLLVIRGLMSQFNLSRLLCSKSGAPIVVTPGLLGEGSRYDLAPSLMPGTEPLPFIDQVPLLAQSRYNWNSTYDVSAMIASVKARFPILQASSSSSKSSSSSSSLSSILGSKSSSSPDSSSILGSGSAPNSNLDTIKSKIKLQANSAVAQLESAKILAPSVASNLNAAEQQVTTVQTLVGQL